MSGLDPSALRSLCRVAEIRKFRTRSRAFRQRLCAAEDSGNKLAKPPLLLIVRSDFRYLGERRGTVCVASRDLLLLQPDSRQDHWQILNKGLDTMRKPLALALTICVGALAIGCEDSKPAPAVPKTDLGAPAKTDGAKTTPSPTTTAPAPK